MTIPSSKTRLTKQRKLILDMVKSVCYHPTAEQVFRLAKRRLPSISVGTVYRNLEMLVDQKMIKRLDIPGEPVRFDADTARKAYFVCKRKRAIYDLHIDPSKIKELIKDREMIDSIDDFNILLFGTSKSDPKERSLRKGQLKH